MKKIAVIVGIVLIAMLATGGYFFLMPRQNQKTKTVYHVGVLSGLSFFATTTDGFKTKMAELGYVEGKNITYDIEPSEIDLPTYDRILRKFVADKVDLIFVFPTEASIEAKSITRDTGIPIVFTNAFTENTGLVASVRAPGGNITGVRWPGPDLAIQRFEIMHQLLPQAKQIWIPYLKGYPIVKSQIDALRPIAAAAGITITELAASSASDLTVILKERAKSGTANAILIIAEPLLVTPEGFTAAAAFAADHRIPIGGAMMAIAGYESVFGVTPQSVPQGKQAALLADKILRGTLAGTLPVVSADGYFQLNYKETQKLGISVSQGLLGRADQIIR